MQQPVSILSYFGAGIVLLTGIFIVVNTWPIYQLNTETGFLLTKTTALRSLWYLPAFYLHVFTGPLILFTGLIQFSRKIRLDYPTIHRLIGKTYIGMIIFLGAPGGFVIGLFANGGQNAQICFSLLATIWWFYTYRAFIHIRNGDVAAHQWLMTLSYALTLSAVLLRLYSFIGSVGFNWRGPEAYGILIWLSWVPQLGVLWAFRYRFS